MNNDDVIVHSNWIKEQHPDWTQDQIDVQSILQCKADEVISENPTKDITDEIIELIVRQAQIWIEKNLPALMEKVSNFFDYLLDNIGDWVIKGFSYLTDLISDYF